MNFESGLSDLLSVMNAVVVHYQEDKMRLVGLVTWLVAWRAANLLSKNLNHAFQAHVLYAVANVCLLTFNTYYGHLEMALMALTFLFTSIKGCITYRPRNNVLIDKKAY